MPYKRRYQSRPKARFRKTVKGVLPRKVYQLGRAVQYLKKVVNVEYKFHDVTLAGTAINSSGVITLLSGIAQGDTQSTRDGNSVRPQSLSFRSDFTMNGSATSSVIRVALIRDKASNGSVPTWLDIYETANVHTSLNLDNSHRFTVLWSDVLIVNNTFAIQKVRKYYNKISGHLKYDGITANASDLTTGHIYLAMISNEGTNTPSINMTSRIRYTDN